MTYEIKLGKKLMIPLIFRQLEELIERLLKTISSKADSINNFVISLESYEEGAMLLAFSLNLEGSFLYLATKGDDLFTMAEKNFKRLMSITG